jgi:GMP synthase PP-ATPase subunit
VRKSRRADKSAVLLPVRTAGAMGDGRSYDSVPALRAATSADGATADFHHFDMNFFGCAATRIINEVRGTSTAGYDRVGVRFRPRSFA